MIVIKHNHPSDEQLRERLNEVAGFCPADNWRHVLNHLRFGRAFYIRQLDPVRGRKVKLGILENL